MLAELEMERKKRRGAACAGVRSANCSLKFLLITYRAGDLDLHGSVLSLLMETNKVMEDHRDVGPRYFFALNTTAGTCLRRHSPNTYVCILQQPRSDV